jgi:biopolymer transport protein ExbB
VNTIDAVKEILLRSGAAWILWLLGGLSVVSIGIMVERFLFYRSRGGDLKALARELDARLAAGEFQQAARELERSSSLAAAIAAAGLRLAERGPAAADKAMQSAVALERGRLERWLAYLGTLGNNAPFIGLFGTVIGVIRAFEELGHGAPGHGTASTSAAAAQVASQAVMASIAEALVATAVGILVALPAVAAFNYFQRRIASLLSGTEVLTNLVLAYLSELNPAPAGGGGGHALSAEGGVDKAREAVARLSPSAG